ncbi:MAG: dihydrodipicolinate synthase family protein [Chloroflexi bacterium]|nr:dihydrodipicolinate synthase family protein [Chloroflexota bacterium]
MSERDWRGSFAIPMTPFDEKDRVDEEVLAAEIEFCIECHVGGIVVPVMVSEFRLLSEEERRTLIRVPIEVSRGRVPIVANVAAVNTPLAVSYAEYAQKMGADAVIAMPSYIHKPDFETIYNYYKAIDEVVDVPIWIQNASVAAMSPDQIVKLCTEIEHVSWVKEEVPPAHKNIAALVAKKSPYVHGVMGGGGARNLITEWQRGAAGCVHACQFCDVVQRIHEMLDAGQLDEAGDLFEKVLPGLVIEGLFGMAYAKEIMIRRGVFKNNRIRTAVRPLDEHDMWEIDRVWERIQPYLIWHKS